MPGYNNKTINDMMLEHAGRRHRTRDEFQHITVSSNKLRKRKPLASQANASQDTSNKAPSAMPNCFSSETFSRLQTGADDAHPLLS
jgi:hypothetical protein